MNNVKDLEIPLSSDFLKKCKEARERAGDSQRAIAARLGVSNQAISNFERGINKPVWIAIEYMKIYGVEP